MGDKIGKFYDCAICQSKTHFPNLIWLHKVIYLYCTMSKITYTQKLPAFPIL